MRTQRLTQRSDCEPECFQPSILTQKSAPLVRLAYLTNGAQIWGVLISLFLPFPQRFQFLEQTQITLIPAGLDLSLFQSFPNGAAFFLGMTAIQKLTRSQIGSKLPEGLRQSVFQFQVQFLCFKGGKAR